MRRYTATNAVQRSLVRPPSSKLLSKARVTDHEVRAIVELIILRAYADCGEESKSWSRNNATCVVGNEVEAGRLR